VRGGGGGDCAHAVGQTREAATPRARRVVVPPPTAVFAAGLFTCRWWRNREVLEWLHNTGCPWDISTCSAAAGGGHLEVLQWAREHHCPWHRLTPAWAAEGGHLAVLQWAREHHCPWDWRTSEYAAREGHLAVLQWVRENDANGEVWSAYDVRRFAVGPRKLEVMAWLDELSVP